VMCEISGLGVDEAKKVFKLVAHKLPIKTRFLAREE